jgi:hypothetical protein
MAPINLNETIASQSGTPPIDDLVPLKALCISKGVSERTGDRWTARPERPLPFIRIGGRKFVSLSTWRRWLASIEETNAGPVEPIKRTRGRPRKLRLPLDNRQSV